MCISSLLLCTELSGKRRLRFTCTVPNRSQQVAKRMLSRFSLPEVFARMSTSLGFRFLTISVLQACLPFQGTGCGLAQQAVVTSQTQAAPDSAPLVTALKAIGWIASPNQGVQCSGTMTRFVGETSSDVPIRIWAYGPRRFRLETDSAAGVSALIVRDGSGKRAPAQKAVTKVSLQTAAAAHQWMAPWLMFDNVMANYVIEKITSSTIAGVTATGYQLSPSALSATVPSTKGIPYDSTFTIWLSAKGLPLQLDYLYPAEDNRFATVALSRAFQGFQLIDGVLVPMEQDVYMGARKISRIVLAQVLPIMDAEDSHFLLPVSVKIQ